MHECRSVLLAFAALVCSANLARTEDPVSASRLEDGRIRLENAAVEAVFDPADAGAAASLRHKATGKPIGVCVTYNESHFKAFREALSIQGMKEARLDPRGRPYELLEAGVTGNTARAVFAGYPYLPPEKATPEQAASGKVRLVKTYTLKKGQSRIGVELEAVNESGQPLPVALWMMSGLRVEGENADVFGPAPAGVLSRSDIWSKHGSTFLKIPEAAGAWTAALGQDAARTGMILAGDPERIESVYDWLAKFNGFTLGFGTTREDLAPGASFKTAYSLLLSRDMPRVDAASGEAAAGIEFAPAPSNGVLPVTVWVLSDQDGEATVSLSMRKLPSPELRPLGAASVRLVAGKGEPARLSAPLDGDGVYVLTADIRTASGARLRAERPFERGLSAETYTAPRRPLKGSSCWAADLGESPLPAWTQDCDREARYPLVPWNAPASIKPPRVLFLGEVGWSTGLFRDLAQRGSLEWDFANLAGIESYPEGEYRKTEQDLFFGKLEAMKPDVVLSAGIRYDALPAEFLTRLLARVREGLGLVIVAAKDEQVKPWTPLLGRPDMTPATEPPTPWDAFFTNGIASAVPFATDRRAFGKGRILMLRRGNLDFYRNDLLPRASGRAFLPGWEYYFGRYLKAIDEVAGAVRATRIGALRWREDALEIDVESAGARAATLVFDVADADGVFAEQGTVPVTLQAGRGTIRVPAESWPVAELVLHAWLLDGTLPASRQPQSRIPAFMLRESHPAPVLDFSASCLVRDNGPAIAAIEVAEADSRLPSAIAVTLTNAPGWEGRPLRVTAEIRNGEETRLVWKGEAPGAAGATAVLTGIRYVPVAAGSLVAVRVFQGDRLVAVKGKRIRAREAALPADDDFAILSAAGIESWYISLRMQEWARREAGFSFPPINYGLGTGFPWKRMPGATLDPPIVDETPLREATARRLREEFEGKGIAYFCLSDEFRLDGEYDFSEATLKAFAGSLKESYGSIDALNRSWQTAFTSFESVRPVLLEEARKRPDRLAPWLDFRLFMDRKVNRRFEVATEEAARISPLIRVGDSGSYEPGASVGIDYYKMCQASRFMVSYTGLRADWTRAFMPTGGVMGVWMGYGWQKPWHPWETLFRGYDFLAWWGFIPSKVLPQMATIRIDGTPNLNFREIGRQQLEIRRGVGRLFVQATPPEPCVFLAYSQASAYTASALERNYAAASAAAVALPAARNVPYSFVADDQAAAGALPAQPGTLFILPGLDALPVEAAAAYAEAWRNGCSLLADAEVAWRDGHGNRLQAGRLDAGFGLRRAGSVPVGQPELESIAWTPEAPAELARTPGQLARALSNVTAEAAGVWATFRDGIPAVVGRTNAAGGRAVWVNTRFEWASRKDIRKAARPEDKPDELSANETVARTAAWMMERAGLRGPVRIEPETPGPRLAVEFRNGQARYYGVLFGTNAADVAITLPVKAHTYDMRQGRYLGLVEAFRDRVETGTLAKAYAQLPYKVTGLSAAPDAAVKKPGETVLIRGRVEAEGGAGGYHVVHAELVEPAGQRPEYGIFNLDAPNGMFEINYPLALNAEPGAWRVELTDAATGVKAVASFTVSE